ncbi:MAG: hypothetical protein PVF74_08890 [Anaerolineales bacterium]
MIYFAIILYIMFGLGYAAGRREVGLSIPIAFISGLLWPFWLGVQIGSRE